MKKFVGLFLVMCGLTAQAQSVGTRVSLSGYFIVTCFDESSKSNCTLDIASIKELDGDSMTCGDGAFYKNIEARIHYVSPGDLRVEQINNIDYFVELQSREQQVYLSTNPLILQDAGPNSTALRRDKEVVAAISQNQATADLLQYQADKLAINFTKRGGVHVLMYGTLEALVLPDRTEPKKYKTPFGYHQYLLLQNKANIIRSVRRIRPSWYLLRSWRAYNQSASIFAAQVY